MLLGCSFTASFDRSVVAELVFLVGEEVLGSRELRTLLGDWAADMVTERRVVIVEGVGG